MNGEVHKNEEDQMSKEVFNSVSDFHRNIKMRKFTKVRDDAILPKRATIGSAGYDLFSAEGKVIPPGEIRIIPTGVTVSLLAHEELQIRCRSGLACKGIMLANGVGTIDSDYYPREIGVILYNSTNTPYEVKKGDRIAQGVFSKYLITDDDSVILETRIGGFGSTGK
jgi:dUTP pyrophosphatase